MADRQPQSLKEVYSEAMETPPVAARLERRFGLGSEPQLRQALYTRLEKLVSESSEGSKVLEVIDSVVCDAVGKSDPGRYFARVVCLRLQERGLMEVRRHVDW